MIKVPQAVSGKIVLEKLLEQELRLLVEAIPAWSGEPGQRGTLNTSTSVCSNILERHWAKSSAGDGWKKSIRTMSHLR